MQQITRTEDDIIKDNFKYKSLINSLDLYGMKKLMILLKVKVWIFGKSELLRSIMINYIKNSVW